MLNFSKAKILFVTFICFAALFYAIPSFFTKDVNPSLKSIFPESRVNLGLDLQGGSQLMLEVDFDYYLKEQLNNLRESLRKEFRDEYIRTIPIINGNKVVFSLTNKDQHKKTKKIIKSLGNKIEIEQDLNNFELFYSQNALVEMKKDVVRQSIEIIRRRVDEDGTKEPVIQAQGFDRILLQVPGVENSAELKSILGKTAKMTFHFVDDNSFSGGFSSSSDVKRLFDSEGQSYLIKKEVVLSGDLLIDANPTYHEGQPAVGFRFNNLGAKKFAKITKENIGKFFAIVLDGKVITAPRINSIIDQGSGVISGSFTTAEAAEVALLLRAGALPAPLKIIEERTVGPSLGLDSIKSGALSTAAGLVIIAIFMLVFYRSFGVFANAALLINIAIIIAVLSLIGGTLTLPGIAGIVLTMGMAVDANVLIFERIKEEVRQKKSVFAAIEQGFGYAYKTIVDSNITTLIVAFFLFAFGSGPIKGFAVTLSIGILASMFSAIILTRMMISIWLRKRRPQKLNLI